MIVCRHNIAQFFALSAIMLAILIFMWIYSPVSIELMEDGLAIRKRISRKVIPLSTIESVVPFEPAPFIINQRVVGSSGFAGYWGWFTDEKIGNYFAYYGRNTDCFLVRLKNGRKYVLGCDECTEMISRLSTMLPPCS